MKKVSRQQDNRERNQDRQEGLRMPKHAPAKRSDTKREMRDVMRDLIHRTG